MKTRWKTGRVVLTGGRVSPNYHKAWIRRQDVFVSHDSHHVRFKQSQWQKFLLGLHQEKGKTTSTIQTNHHSRPCACLWVIGEVGDKEKSLKGTFILLGQRHGRRRRKCHAIILHYTSVVLIDVIGCGEYKMLKIECFRFWYFYYHVEVALCILVSIYYYIKLWLYNAPQCKRLFLPFPP